MSSRLVAGTAPRSGSGSTVAPVVLGGVGGVVVLAMLLMVTLVAALGAATFALGGTESSSAGSTSASALARREIPPATLLLYQRAAQRYGLDWAVLAGIGKVECDHGRDPDPSCSREGDELAGAGGPMQFIASTWAQYGLDGNGDGGTAGARDAIISAANYLHASGAPVTIEPISPTTLRAGTWRRSNGGRPLSRSTLPDDRVAH